MKKLSLLAVLFSSLAFGQGLTSIDEFTNAARFPQLSVKNNLTLQSNKYLCLDGTASGTCTTAGLRYNLAGTQLELLAGGLILSANTATNAVSVQGSLLMGNNRANVLTIAGGVTAAPVTLTASGSDTTISISFVPKGSGTILIPSGAAGLTGTCTLVAGTCTVSTTALTANSKPVISRNTAAGTVGDLRLGTQTPGTSFVINSASASDTSTVNWLFFN